jgi:LDH2 family malate/lactate/ureidoglycolate dehydrogenase
MRFGVPFTILNEAPGSALVDGGYGVGSVVATRAMDLAIRKAKQAGVAGVWVQHGGDFMMTANHSMQALEHDQVGITMRNENPRVAPWGAGNDSSPPISVAIPTAEEPPIVIDAAGGSARRGCRHGRPDAKLLPSAVTNDGVYTDDPLRS